MTANSSTSFARAESRHNFCRYSEQCVKGKAHKGGDTILSQESVSNLRPLHNHFIIHLNSCLHRQLPCVDALVVRVVGGFPLIIVEHGSVLLVEERLQTTGHPQIRLEVPLGRTVLEMGVVENHRGVLIAGYVTGGRILNRCNGLHLSISSSHGYRSEQIRSEWSRCDVGTHRS